MEEAIIHSNQFFIPTSTIMNHFPNSKFLISNQFHYIIPLMISFAIGKYFFFRLLQSNSFSLRRIFKSMDLKKENDIIHSCFYVLCLLLSVTIGEAATGQEKWRSDYVECYRGWPDNHIHSWGAKFYYIFCISFYLYSLISVFFEAKKKDFIAMVLHHLVTITTLGLSAYIGHIRIGTVIMLLFDACDIALEFAKIFNKCKEDIPATMCFSVFVLLWLRNRMFIFPLYIVPSIVNAEVLSGNSIPYHSLHVTIIVVLMGLQVYWTYFILKKMYLLAVNGLYGGGDPREEKSN